MSTKVLKRLEVKSKQVFIWILSHLYRRSPRILNPHTIRKVLFLRYDRLGDMVISTPVFRNFKKHYPEAYIGVVGTPANIKAIEKDPYVDAAYVYDKRSLVSVLKLLLEVRSVRYEAVVDLVPLESLTGGLITSFLAPETVKIGAGKDKTAFFYDVNISIPDRKTRPIVEQTMDIIRPFGICIERCDTRLHFALCTADSIRADRFIHSDISVSPDHLLIGLNNAAGRRQREWTVEKFIQLGRQLHQRYPHIRYIIFSSAQKKEMAARIYEGLQDIAFLSFQSGNIREIAALIAHMDVFVSPDTSLVHIAAALQIPIIALYVQQSLPVWLPYRALHRYIAAPAGMPVAEIMPKDVVETAVHLIEELARTQRGGS